MTFRDQPWFDREGYPFASHYLELESGKLHYLDEGSGSPIVFVHGTPSFSYEYRHLIAGLRSSHRCIAPDHLGFGFSDRPPGFSYSLADHSGNLEQLLEKLGIERFTLVVHDFGGPIALPLALRNPERIERLVLMNSWLWSMNLDPKFQKNRRLVDTALMRFLYLRLNFSASFMVKASWGRREPLTRERHTRFKGMFPDRDSRLGTWAFARSLVTEDAYLDSLGAQLGRLGQVPALVIWGAADAMVGPVHLQRWKKELPHAEFVELSDVGHFPQDEAGTETLAHVRHFLLGWCCSAESRHSKKKGPEALRLRTPKSWLRECEAALDLRNSLF